MKIELHQRYIVHLQRLDSLFRAQLEWTGARHAAESEPCFDVKVDEFGRVVEASSWGNPVNSTRAD